MLVNFIQVSYALGISSISAKIMMFPFVDRLKEEDTPKNKRGRADNMISKMKLINKDDLVESSLLKMFFKHPSPMLNGKDRIEYTISSIRTGIPVNLKKKIVEDMSCLKAGRISGKYRALLYILNKEDIEVVNSLIKSRRAEFIKYGGKFPTRKPMKGL